MGRGLRCAYLPPLSAGDSIAGNKPFAMGELLSRIRAMLRRRSEYTPDRLSYGDLSLDRCGFTLQGPGGDFHLSSKEFQLMELLMTANGRILSTEQFMERIWGSDSDAEINVVWVFLSNLRKKLVKLNSAVTIRSYRGTGYTLELSQ